jgi:RNA polymerase sigma factor (sigma-70 family)
VRLSIEKSKTEEELIKGCLNNDPKAQRIIYEKYAGAMFAVCSRYIKEKTDAEDVLIKGFMKAFSQMAKYKGEGNLGGWIKKIMINEALMFLRSTRTMYVEVDIDHANYNQDEHFSHNQLEADDLLKMVNNLPVGYRTIFNLYAIEGYSHKEIAEQLNISENTSKSQLSRARVLLQKMLMDADKKLKENTYSS